MPSIHHDATLLISQILSCSRPVPQFPKACFESMSLNYSCVLCAGFPSVGKSTLLTVLTGTKSEAAAYEFTTLTCIPGVIHYNDAKIQLLDLPGIIEGAAQGKGKHPFVLAGRPYAFHWVGYAWAQ